MAKRTIVTTDEHEAALKWIVDEQQKDATARLEALPKDDNGDPQVPEGFYSPPADVDEAFNKQVMSYLDSLVRSQKEAEKLAKIKAIQES